MDFLDAVRLTPAQSIHAVQPDVLFDELIHDAGYEYLRGSQRASLRQWAQRRDERDLVTVMGSGVGKALVGLLALQSELNRGVTPVVYVCADARQALNVVETAKHHNLPVADYTEVAVGDDGQPPVNRIIVTTIDQIVAPKSIFTMPALEKVAMLVVDDAPACLRQLQTVMTWRIDREKYPEWYEHLLTWFENEPQTQSPIMWQALRKTASAAVALSVPYWTLAKYQAHILAGPVAPPTWIQSLANVECYIDQTGIEFQPRQLPIEQLPVLNEAVRRLFLVTSLTTGTDLVQQWGLAPSSLLAPIEVRSTGDAGEKLIITPQQFDIQLNDSRMRSYLKYLFESGLLTTNLVIIVPTDEAAIIWQKMGAKVYQSTDQKKLMTDLTGPKLMMAVVIDGYRHLDLRGAASHCLVLDGLPNPNRLADRIALQRDPGARAKIRTIVELIEAGLGRTVRSGADSSLVFLLGDQLQALTVMPEIQELFSPQTRAQLQFSQKLGTAIKRTSRTASDITIKLNQLIKAVLTREPRWRAIYHENINYNYRQIKSVAYCSIKAAQAAQIRQANQLALAGKFQAAATLISEVAQPTAATLEQQATYQYQLDPAKAVVIQKQAYRENPAYLRPAGVAYLPVPRPELTTGKRLKAYLEALNFDNGNDLAIYFEARVMPLDVKADFLTEDFQRALAWVGMLVGFETTRPTVEMIAEPSELWRGLEQDVVFQINLPDDPVGSEVMTQAAIEWYQAEYGDASAQLVLVQAKRTLTMPTNLIKATRVLTATKVEELVRKVDCLAEKLSARMPSEWTADALESLMRAEKLTMADFVENFTVPARKAKKVTHS